MLLNFPILMLGVISVHLITMEHITLTRGEWKTQKNIVFQTK